MNDDVRVDVLAALREEAFSHVMHTLFAEQARAEGLDDLAGLYTGIAQVELRDHFAKLAGLYGLVGTSVENLEQSIGDEDDAIHARYDAYAAGAVARDELEVAELLALIAEERRTHLRSLEQALEDLEIPV